MRYTLTAIVMLAFISACSSSMKTADVANVQATCADVDEKIATLTKERGTNLKRLKAGVQSVVPFSAAVNIVSGNYKQNVSVATGEWAREIDAKLVELEALKASCEAHR